MRRFSFKLEKVLELRRYAEREWELKLAEATRRVIDTETRITDWGEKRGDAAAIHAPLGPVDMSTLYSREEYLNRVDQQVAILHRRLALLEEERGEVRDGYLEASSRRKALSKLEERRSEEYYRAALREEGKAIDEIAGTQAVKRILESEETDV